MTPPLEREERAVRIETVFGTVEGTIRCNPMIRTLDELNQSAIDYLVVHDSKGVEGPLAIRKEAILFVREQSVPSRNTRRVLVGTYWKASIELRVRDWLVRGTVHMPPGGEPLQRLNQRAHLFLALTGASASGPQGRFEAPFLAINHRHVLSGREVDGVAIEAHGAARSAGMGREA